MKIGSIYAEIRAKRDKLKGDLKGAEDDIKSSASIMQGALSTIGFASLGLAAAAFGATVVRSVADGVKSYTELERKMLRTESLIRATGNAANISSKQFLDFANDLDLATLQNRDAILDGINAMQTFRSVSGETFKRSIELSVDLAEVLGTNLRSQVVQLGKALEDPITGLTALRRVGVSFTEQQKEQIKTMTEAGNIAGAQKEILRTLEVQVGGAAAGAAGGLAGKVDALSFRWREFKESLASSESVINFLGSAIDSLADSLEKLSRMDLRNLNPIFAMGQNILKAGGGGKAPIGVLQMLGMVNRGEFDTDVYGLGKYGEFGPPSAMAGYGVAGGGGYTVPTRETEEGPLEEFYKTNLSDLIGYDIDSGFDEISAARQEAEAEMLRQRQQSLKDYWEFEFQGYSEQADRLIELDRLRSESQAEAAQKATNALGNALQLAGQQNEVAFRAYKAYKIATATISGIEAAISAWNAGMSVGGPYAPYIAAAYAAASLAWTGAQIAAIGGAQYSARPSGATSTYRADPTTGVYEPEKEESRGKYIFNIYGDVSDPDAFVDKMVEKINEAADRDVFINYARETRETV